MGLGVLHRLIRVRGYSNEPLLRETKQRRKTLVNELFFVALANASGGVITQTEWHAQWK